MELRGNHGTAHRFPFVQDLANHRLPIDDHHVAVADVVWIRIRHVRCGLKLEFHRSLSFERNAFSYSNERCNCIEQPAYAGCPLASDSLFQHLSKQRRLTSSERPSTKDFIQERSRTVSRVTNCRI